MTVTERFGTGGVYYLLPHDRGAGLDGARCLHRVPHPLYPWCRLCLLVPVVVAGCDL
jgi:hypothetical protein